MRSFPSAPEARKPSASKRMGWVELMASLTGNRSLVSPFVRRGCRLSRSGGGSGLGLLLKIGQHLLPRGFRQIGQTGALADLQDADVGGDGPAVLDRHLAGVGRHHAEPFGHGVEEV